jgi:membrane protein
VDGATLLAALENDKLSVSLASLLALRASARAVRAAAEAEGRNSSMPHQTA